MLLTVLSNTRLPSAVSLLTIPGTINSMVVKVTTEWAFHSLKLAERETVYVASSSRCGSDMCPGQSFTEISDWNSSNACHVLWELPHVTPKAFQPAHGRHWTGRPSSVPYTIYCLNSTIYWWHPNNGCVLKFTCHTKFALPLCYAVMFSQIP